MSIAAMRARALTPVDAASLAAFRIGFGVVMTLGLVRFLASGWIAQLYVEPRMFFTYPGFAWVRPWSETGMYLHYGVLTGLAVAIAVGWHTRVAALLFGVGFAYTQLIDVTNYLNHHYLVVLLAGLIAVLPTHTIGSLDARRARRRGTPLPTVVPAWMVWLVRAQIGIVYVSAGLAKAKADWLFEAQPLNLWLAARTHVPVIGGWLDEPAVAYVFSWAGFLFDTTIVGWLCWRRTRVPAFVVLIGFHGMTGYLFNIGMFPLIMTTSAMIFFSPAWPRVLWAWGQRVRGRREAPLAPLTSTPVPAPPRWVTALVVAYVAFQALWPQRHLVYPGEVLWNEDGMRFAWHVMLREKHGATTFIAELPDGRRLQISPRSYLTWRQEREMSAQPDLILQLARRIGADLRQQGHGDIKVFVDSRVSLNGRAPRPMIDPAVDLLDVVDLGQRWWVGPAPSEKPPHVSGINR